MQLIENSVTVDADKTGYEPEAYHVLPVELQANRLT